MRERSHLFDFRTNYCRHCGIADEQAINDRVLFCAATENVVAISHMVRGRLLMNLEAAVTGANPKP